MFKQVELAYGFADLEPHIDELTMMTHYGKHHAAYTANFNAAVEKAGLAGKTAEEIFKSLDSVEDAALRTTLRNQGGGYYNHNLYFSTLKKDGGGDPVGALKAQVDAQFGGADALREKLSALAMGQFGSGWAWLSANAAGELRLSNSLNQDNPLMDGEGYAPILTIDVWEHAYYLKYKNLRADHVKAFWNVVDWDAVNALYEAIKGA